MKKKSVHGFPVERILCKNRKNRKETNMLYRSYGQTGYQASLFGMGCMRLPRMQDKDGNTVVDREKAYEMIRYAATHGVNYFDTAYGYHNMTSESVVGEALDGGLRDKVWIATKQPFNVMGTKENLRRNLENTLTKLRTDHIDVYLIHNIQYPQWEKIKAFGALEEYEKLKQEGLIRNIAFSYHGGYDGFAEILGYYPWAMCQVQHNMLDINGEVTTKGVKLAGKKGCALVIMEPLRGGGLSSVPQNVQDVYNQYPAARSGAEWAFRYVASNPEVSCILSGVSTMEQLKDNIRIFSQEDMGSLNAQEKAIIDQACAAYESRVTIPCTGCEYCMPCPNGVDIPGVFKRYNMGMMYDNFDNARRTYMFAARSGNDASHCIRCGACERKCPQHIAIMDQLAMAHKKLDGWQE